MKLSFNRRFKHKAVIDITPLIDLVFLLVAFFMVTSSLGGESSITVNLPKAHESGDYKAGTHTVTVTKDNKFYFDDRPINRKEISGELDKWKRKSSDVSVVIRGDRESNYESIIYVIDKINSAGIPKFIISAIR